MRQRSCSVDAAAMAAVRGRHYSLKPMTVPQAPQLITDIRGQSPRVGTFSVAKPDLSVMSRSPSRVACVEAEPVARPEVVAGSLSVGNLGSYLPQPQPQPVLFAPQAAAEAEVARQQAIEAFGREQAAMWERLCVFRRPSTVALAGRGG